MSSKDESALFRLKNLIDHSVISIYKNQFKIGRAPSKSIELFSLEINRIKDKDWTQIETIIRIDQMQIFIFCLANDLTIENNRYVSSAHCTFEFNDGHIYIRDTSSNGTLINRTKKINKNESVRCHCWMIWNLLKSFSHLSYKLGISFIWFFEKTNPERVRLW